VVKHIARRFVRRGEPLEDLVQVATVGLNQFCGSLRSRSQRGSLSFTIPTLTGELRRYFRDYSGNGHLVLRFFRDLTQTQSAEHVGVSQMHVSRVLHQTLAFLQKRMATLD
jgi:RNA polymerase sigma-B factor